VSRGRGRIRDHDYAGTTVPACAKGEGEALAALGGKFFEKWGQKPGDGVDEAGSSMSGLGPGLAVGLAVAFSG
jgi:hypothetical protein